MIVNRRYPGTTPFEKEQKAVFFGREIDIENLLKRIKFEPLLLLYSKSGLGKSSLLNAGVQPRLETQKNIQIFNFRFTRYAKGGISPVDNVVSKITSSSDKRSVLDRIINNENSLWYHLKKDQIQRAEKQKYILIFDQFEELFSYPDEEVYEFKKQMADLLYVQIPQHFRDELYELQDLDPDFISTEDLEKLYQAIDIRVITSIRSDKMSLLNALSDYLPNILKNYYELKALDRERARDAIINPAQADGEFLSDKFSYEDILLENILDYLTEDNTKPIETFQLQIICARAEVISMRKKKGKSGIKNPVVQQDELKDLKNIFADHYSETIALIKDAEERIVARKLLEDKLIVDGNRISLPDVLVMKEEGMTMDLINHLVNSRILRAEPNTVGGISYELSHDTLIEPISAARKIRVDKEEEDRLEAERKEELRIALEKSEKERIEREKERKRQRQITSIVFVAAIISIAFGIFGFVNMQKSKSTLQKLIVKDAESYYEEENFNAARGKYLQLKDYGVDIDEINEKIDSCNFLDSLNKIFYKKKKSIDTLVVSKNIKDLHEAGKLLQQLDSLNYTFGDSKLREQYATYMNKTAIIIKDKLINATKMFRLGLSSDAIDFVKELEQLFPGNALIIDFKKKNGII